MLIQTIMPAPTKPERVSEADWKAILKLGEVSLPAVKARENIKNSRGAYVLKPDAVAVEIKTGIALELDNMSNTQLKTIVLAAGKRLGTKKITRRQLVDLALKCVEESIQVEDEDDDAEVD